MIGNLFINVINLSISGSLIALILFALCSNIKIKISKTWQYYIWLSVIVRVIVTFKPEANLMNAFYNLINGNKQFTSSLLNISANKTFNIVIDYLGLTWLIIVALLVAKKIISYMVYTHFIRKNSIEITDMDIRNTYTQVCNDMKLKKCIGLYSCKRINCPMLIGIFKPYIILPEANLQIKDGLKYVFLHEITHYKKKDFLYKWLIQIVSCIHFFNPIFYFIKNKINNICEFSCDESVIKRLDINGKKGYGSALIESLEINIGYKQRTALSLMLCEDTKQIIERLTAIKRYERKSWIMTTATFILTSAICVSTFYIGVFGNICANCECVIRNLS